MKQRSSIRPWGHILVLATLSVSLLAHGNLAHAPRPIDNVPSADARWAMETPRDAHAHGTRQNAKNQVKLLMWSIAIGLNMAWLTSPWARRRSQKGPQITVND